MRNDNVIQAKSFAFAVRIIELYQQLSKKKEFVLSKQILRSGMSIGANVEEAIGAQSRLDFLHKLGIAYKEARETLYWLRLLKETNYLSENEFKSYCSDNDELCRIIGSIQRTTKANS